MIHVSRSSVGPFHARIDEALDARSPGLPLPSGIASSLRDFLVPPRRSSSARWYHQDCPQQEPGCFRRLYMFLERQVTADGDAGGESSAERQSKVLALVINLLACVSAIGYGLFWYCMRGPYSALTMAILSVVSLSGAGHIYWSKSKAYGQVTAYYGPWLGCLLLYWLAGSNVRSNALACWGLTAPQIAVYGYHSLRPAMLAFAAGVVLVVVLTLLDALSGPGWYTPQTHIMPPAWESFFHVSNIVFPCTISFLVCVSILLRLQAEKQHLEDSLRAARAVAQKIVDFEFIGLPERSSDCVVDLLLQVRRCLCHANECYPPPPCKSNTLVRATAGVVSATFGGTAARPRPASKLTLACTACRTLIGYFCFRNFWTRWLCHVLLLR